MNFINKHKTIFSLIIIYSVIFFSLCLIEHVTPDSAGYLRETILITQLLENGQWFGNHGVGIHGFLFKLPVALAFMITGPSVFVASIYTSILSVIVIILFYKILNKLFNSVYYALFGVALITINYRYIISSISYLREVPLILSVLLFVNSVISKKNIWLIGFYLLLIFEAKEYMFFALAPAYVLWGFIYEAHVGGSKILIAKKILIRLFAAFSPTILSLVLMFYSAVVPVNMFAASLLGIVDKGFHEIHNLDAAAKTRAVVEQMNVVKTADPSPEKLISFTTILINSALEYIRGLFSSTNFSFESLPLAVFLPSLLMSVVQFKRWRDSGNKEMLMMPLTLLSFYFIYALRLGRARYLLPILPISVVFFIHLLKEKSVKVRSTILLLSTLALVFSLPTERANLWLRTATNTAILLAIIITHSLQHLKVDFKKIYTLYLLPLVLIPASSMYLILLPYTDDINNIFKYGINYETNLITSMFSKNESVWINNYLSSDNLIELLLFYREDVSIDPEWYNSLLPSIPKKSMLVKEEPNTFIFSCTDPSFRLRLSEKNIQKVVIVSSTVNDQKFLDEECRYNFQSENWLRIEKIEHLRNKKVYVFKTV